uniref:Uncharacterized protein n=1 Tax=Rhizophora mucronata TaxID=61149 RepID=A0A2P2NAW3_RHIMU
MFMCLFFCQCIFVEVLLINICLYNFWPSFQ